ncbi:MAG: DEAD/DEAH box helicase [Pseudomonadota bacterium]
MLDTLRNRMEFHRNGLALLPDPDDSHPGVAYQIGDSRTPHSVRHCTCRQFRRNTCPHILALAAMERELGPQNGLNDLFERFQSGMWHSLAVILAEDSRTSLDAIHIRRGNPPSEPPVRIVDNTGEWMLCLSKDGKPLDRFLERIGKQTKDHQPVHRAVILEHLARYTLTDNERIMQERGFRTRRQSLERNFWYRLAYHGFMEYGHHCGFMVAIGKSGEFLLSVTDRGGASLFELHIPKNRVRPLLGWFEKYLPGKAPFILHSEPLRIIFRIRLNDEKDLVLTTHYRFTLANGNPVYFSKDDLAEFQYGDLVYLKDHGVMVTIAPPDPRAPRITSDDKMVVKRSRVPAFLDQFSHVFSREPYELDNAVQRLRIFKTFDSVTISPEALRRDWCWLSVAYRFGKSTLSLRDILRAKKEGEKFVETDEGWVDIDAEPLDGLNGVSDLSTDEKLENHPDAVRLRRMDLFRVQATTETPFKITGETDRVALLKQILKMKPAEALPPMKGFTSQLRNYQNIGVEWLWFLYENGFGGLLCDDMGLGKTHQAMALMSCLKARPSTTNRFLVVCPTTVLSHWEQKIKAYAPGLTARVYHGGGRNLPAALEESDVLLTSYGILRRDIAPLSALVFTLAVFDEIQYVKNTATQAYVAATQIQAEMKLGMTGTPIENALSDLKALMDLALPAYLGRDREFRDRYVTALKDDDKAMPRKRELSRLISPFTLRRLKKTVLHDLPEKIEDIRTCRLSAPQAKLYREAIELRAQGILEALKNKNTAVPYIHIFALLTLLKQICDHPALIQPSVDDFAAHPSGKWELFKELLAESLDSGQKVVVYTQFLGMVRIMEKHLTEQAIGYVTLTGASRKRGDIIRRFNEDPECRVYVGSLKAGGTGVDLVGGSVVIHYDRWWNAAKEDQATDRVHRIGQTRGVQVFKLVTEGTLEEKISAIIMTKRDLMDSIVKEDDPGLLKTFSREELVAMLSLPEGDLMREEERE